MDTLSGETSESCKDALPDFLFLGVQYGGHNPAVSDVYVLPVSVRDWPGRR